MIKVLKSIITQIFDAKILSLKRVGGGMSGEVFKLEIDKPPYNLAVKTAKNGGLLKQECQYIEYISNIVDIKFPKLYHQFYGEHNFVIMEFFDGVNCADKYLLKAPKRIRIKVASQIADNILKLQKIKGNKFGELLAPCFENWHDYYRPFIDMVAEQAQSLKSENLYNNKIYQTLEIIRQNYDAIFDKPISEPTPIHGDYWAQNIMIDNNYNLIGVVDPFNCMWADSEYELFALNAVYGKKLPVLQQFLSKTKVSDNFFLKNSVYIFISEVFWVCKLKHNNIKYLNFLIKNFKKELKKYIGKQH